MRLQQGPQQKKCNFINTGICLRNYFMGLMQKMGRLLSSILLYIKLYHEIIKQQFAVSPYEEPIYGRKEQYTEIAYIPAFTK